MATQYSLYLHNRSTKPGYFCIYATGANTQQAQGGTNYRAWAAHPANPNGDVEFKWLLNYSFSWNRTDVLSGDISYTASGHIPADPNDPKTNKAYLDINDYGYELTSGDDRANAPIQGSMAITTSANIPLNDVSIGIGIDGDPIMAVPAIPNYTFTFFPVFKYWIAFGDYKKGQVLDLNNMGIVQELDFKNHHKLEVTVDVSNNWTVKPFYD
jgi:hypothetical protein